MSIGILLSYGIPISLHLFNHHKVSTEKGPFNLGFASQAFAFVSVGWIGASCVVVCLPTTTPVTSESFNYAPLALGLTIFSIGMFWVVKARKDFVGPAYGRFRLTDTGDLLSSKASQ